MLHLFYIYSLINTHNNYCKKIVFKPFTIFVDILPLKLIYIYILCINKNKFKKFQNLPKQKTHSPPISD